MCKVRPVELELIDKAVPYHAKPYPIPKLHEKQVKKEHDRLVSSRVLKNDYESTWAAATFYTIEDNG